MDTTLITFHLYVSSIYSPKTVIALSTVPRRSYVRLIAARDFPSCRQCLFLEKLAEIRSREQNVLGSLVTHFLSILEYHGPRAMWFVYRRTSQCMCSH